MERKVGATDDSLRREQRDVDLLVELLASHSGSLRLLTATLYTSRWRTNLVASASAALGPFIAAIGIFLSGQFGLGSTVSVIMLTLFAISLAAVVILVMFILFFEVRRNRLVQQDIRISYRQLERIARVASEAEEHSTRDAVERVRLETYLTEAEEALRQAQSFAQ